MKVSMSDNIVEGGTAVGGSYYFGGSGGTGVLVLDEPDPKLARARIREALSKAAKHLEEKSKNKTDEKRGRQDHVQNEKLQVGLTTALLLAPDLSQRLQPEEGRGPGGHQRIEVGRLQEPVTRARSGLRS
jgi:hypothetical protein